MSRERRQSGQHSFVTACFALTLALLLVAACSSSGGGKSKKSPSVTVTSTGAALKGAPVKVMTITSIESQGPTDPVIGFVAKIYEKYANAHGGIGGRPLQVTVCDDKGSPATATACARQAVADKDVAVIGSFTFYGAGVLPVLQSAGIAWFGICCPVSAPELSSKISFPIGSAFSLVGEILRAKQDGCKKISAVIVNGTEPYVPVIKNAMKSVGLTLVSNPEVLPLTAQDYSSQLTQATSGGTDCIVTIVNESLFKPFFSAFAATGSKARIYGLQGNLDAVSIKGFESITNGSVIAGSYPDITSQPFATYRSALTQYGAPKSVTDGGKYDYNSLGGLGTWTAYAGFTKIAAPLAGTLTAATFLTAASGTADLKLDGMAPDVDFTKEWTDGLPGYNRMFNRTVVFQKIKDGKVVPLTTNFEDVTAATLGKPTK